MYHGPISVSTGTMWKHERPAEEARRSPIAGQRKRRTNTRHPIAAITRPWALYQHDRDSRRSSLTSLRDHGGAPPRILVESTSVAP